MKMFDKEITKKKDYHTKNRVKCKCGNSLTIPKLVEKKLCSWCGYWVYRDKQVEFREKMKKELKSVDKYINV